MPQQAICPSMSPQRDMRPVHEERSSSKHNEIQGGGRIRKRYHRNESHVEPDPVKPKFSTLLELVDQLLATPLGSKAAIRAIKRVKDHEYGREPD